MIGEQLLHHRAVVAPLAARQHLEELLFQHLGFALFDVGNRRHLFALDPGAGDPLEGLTKVIASPLRPIRPVRPMRWT